jgi:hypothetical protein
VRVIRQRCSIRDIRELNDRRTAQHRRILDLARITVRLGIAHLKERPILDSQTRRTVRELPGNAPVERHKSCVSGRGGIQVAVVAGLGDVGVGVVAVLVVTCIGRKPKGAAFYRADGGAEVGVVVAGYVVDGPVDRVGDGAVDSGCCEIAGDVVGFGEFEEAAGRDVAAVVGGVALGADDTGGDSCGLGGVSRL